MSGVTGLVGVYYVGARTRPQLIGCALAQEPGVLNFRLRVANNGGRWICGDSLISGLGLQTMEGDGYAETGRKSDCALVDYKLRSNYKNHQAYIWTGDGLLWSWVQR